MSQGVAEIALGLSVMGLLYVYLGYPLLLRPGAGARTFSPAGAGERPAASVIVAAFNEESVIRQKAANVVEQLNPGDELLVVSDGSTDGTEARVSEVLDARLRLLRQSPRQGKNAALNRGVREARGSILVFTDANALLAPGALDRLLAPFRDEETGLVSGQGLYGERDRMDTRVVSNAYVRYESALRNGEAARGFMAGVDGALYAMRRELYEELPLDQVHDLLHPIQVALAGRRVVFAPGACTVEPPSRDARSERRRQVRIIAQGFRVLARTTPELLRRGHVKETWMLASHRLLRWMGWLLVLLALGSNLVLLDVHWVYRLLFAGQCLFFGLALVGLLAERFSFRLGLLALPYFFCVVTWAGFAGLLEALRGRTHAVWAKQGGVA